MQASSRAAPCGLLVGTGASRLIGEKPCAVSLGPRQEARMLVPDGVCTKAPQAAGL